MGRSFFILGKSGLENSPHFLVGFRNSWDFLPLLNQSPKTVIFFECLFDEITCF